MTPQLALPHDARHCLPAEVQEWWDAWRSRPSTKPKIDYLQAVIDVLRATS